MKNNRREIYLNLAKSLGGIVDTLDGWGRELNVADKKFKEDIKYMRGVAASLELKACLSG